MRVCRENESTDTGARVLGKKAHDRPVSTHESRGGPRTHDPESVPEILADHELIEAACGQLTCRGAADGYRLVGGMFPAAADVAPRFFVRMARDNVGFDTELQLPAMTGRELAQLRNLLADH